MPAPEVDHVKPGKIGEISEFETLQRAEILSNQPAIEARQVSKRYGKFPVLDKVTFQVLPGEVYALAGPNGAGKTTLIKIITGLSFPTEGKMMMLGNDVHQGGAKVRRALGAVVEAPAAFYPHMTGRDNLRAHAQLAGGYGYSMDPSQPLKLDDARIREVLTLVELLRMADRNVREYSLGQRQRLGLAAAMLSNPRVMVLDEPTSGLDPLGINLVHRILSSMAGGGTAVILSTHHLREVSGYAHRVGILSSGKMIEEVNLNERSSAFRFRVDDAPKAAAALSTQPFVTRAYARAPYVIAHLESEVRAPEAMRTLITEGVRIFEAAPDHFDLYDYYREKVENDF
jgi:ABC-2 type transport system ATP-binding protein